MILHYIQYSNIGRSKMFIKFDSGNGIKIQKPFERELQAMLVLAHELGRDIASPQEAREILEIGR